MSAEPTHKPAPIVSDGYRFYWSGGKLPALELEPGRFIVGGRDVTAIVLRQGWLDLDEYRPSS